MVHATFTPIRLKLNWVVYHRGILRYIDLKRDLLLKSVQHPGTITFQSNAGLSQKSQMVGQSTGVHGA
jgi:hypothetical protein